MRTYLKLMILPAVISLVPLEMVGLSGNVLQRLPLLLDNGIPYLDLAVLPVLFFAGVLFLRVRVRSVDWIVVFPQIAMAFFLWAVPQGLALNQAFGLFLGLVSVSAYTLSASMYQYESYSRLFDRMMYWQTVFGALLAALLVLHVYDILGYAKYLLVTIDRFEGESFRVRWEAVRGVEKMAAAASVTWAMYQVMKRKSLHYLIVPVIFSAQQIAVSSRGGVLLVLFSALIPVYVFPPEKVKKTGRLVYALLGMVVLLAGIVAILSSDSGQALVRNVGEISDDDSIRNRMMISALLLFLQSPIFGNGYFDLYDTPEWSPFLLQNMLLPIHNVFLHYLVYYGVFGTVLFGGGVFFAGYQLIVLRRLLYRSSFANDFRFVVLAGVGASIYVSGLYMIVFQTFDRIGALYFWGACGLASALIVRVRKSSSILMTSSGRQG